jgi:hypothetical protein
MAPIQQNEESRPMLANFNRQKYYWIALVLFLVSLTTPAAFESEWGIAQACTQGGWDRGLGFFIFGPFGIFSGQVGWFANPAMLTAALLRRRKATALILALLAILFIVITSISFTTMWNDAGGNPICQLGIGYYLWLLSSIALLGAIISEPKTLTKPRAHAESP